MLCKNTVRKATPDNDEPVAGFIFHEMKRKSHTTELTLHSVPRDECVVELPLDTDPPRVSHRCLTMQSTPSRCLVTNMVQTWTTVATVFQPLNDRDNSL